MEAAGRAMWNLFRNPLKVFRKETEKAFAFLERDYGFKAPDWKKDPCWDDADLEYWNATTGVVVKYEQSWPGIFVMFARLSGGRLPQYPVFVRDQPELQQFYLDDLVALREPAAKLDWDESSIWKASEVERIVRAYADLTRKHAGRILSGDFAEFAELEKVVRGRADALGESEYPRTYKFRQGKGYEATGPDQP